MRKKNRIKRKNTRMLVGFCKFVTAIFVQFGGVIYYFYIYFYNTEETLFPSLFLKPVIIKHVE